MNTHLVTALRSKSRSLAVGSSLARFQRGFATSKAVYKSAIVTGGGQGLGKAIALRLARDGFDLCINDLKVNSKNVEDVVNEIKSLGRKAIPAWSLPALAPSCSKIHRLGIDGVE